MLKLNELETKWLRYKIKTFVPHFIISLSLIVILLSLSFIDFTDAFEVATKETIQTTKTTQLVIKEQEPITVVPTKTIVEIASKNINTPLVPMTEKIQNKDTIKKLTIQPSLEFIRNMKENAPEYYSEYEDTPSNLTYQALPSKKKIQTIETVVVEENIQHTPIVEPQVLASIQIKRQNTQEDIQHVIKRFKKSNNPALSLFIAKKYYEIQNYNQAYNYALITNEINNDIEDSWIVFAKSLYKLKQKDKAITVLQEYISNSHSHRAKILLENIKTGKIK